MKRTIFLIIIIAGFLGCKNKSESAITNMIKGMTFSKYVHLGLAKYGLNESFNFKYTENNVEKANLKVLDDKDTSIAIDLLMSAPCSILGKGSFYQQVNTTIGNINIQNYYYTRVPDFNGYLYYMTLPNNHQLVLIANGSRHNIFLNWVLLGDDKSDMIEVLDMLRNNIEEFNKTAFLSNLNGH